jgi:hypothetical protein
MIRSEVGGDMDGSYKHVSIRAYWRSGDRAASDNDHGQQFDEFAKAVVVNLRLTASVGASTTGGAHGEYRDIQFSAARPIAQEDWVKAITDAARDCGVLSDQSQWSMD